MSQKAQKLELTVFDSAIHKRVYLLNINYFLYAELIELQDHSFKGRYIMTVSKINKKEVPVKILKHALIIPADDVEYLMKAVHQEQIETLVDCGDIEGYVIGNDGFNLQVQISTKELNRNYGYWEPENDRYQNPQLKEIQRIRAILKLLRSKIDLYGLFDRYTATLPPGRYAYGGIVLTKSYAGR